MEEIKIKLPENLKGRRKEIERELEEFVVAEEKRRLVSLLLDRLMSEAAQLSDEELVALGRKFKKGRFNQLKEEGLV